MSNQKIPILLTISLFTTPISLPAGTPSSNQAQDPSISITPSHRSSVRRMKHQLATLPTETLLLEEKPKTDSSNRLGTDKIVEFAQKSCPNEGTLQKTRDYVYLKLNDGYLTNLFHKIKETNPDIRWPSFRGGIGPHISIIRHDEWKGTPPQKIAEIGKQYLFTPIRIDVVQTEHKRLWVLVVEPSAELAAVRNQYAIGAMPHGHAFHITLAQETF